MTHSLDLSNARLFWESMPKKKDGQPLSRDEFRAFLEKGYEAENISSANQANKTAFCEKIALAATPEEISNLSLMAQVDLATVISRDTDETASKKALSALFEKSTLDQGYNQWRKNATDQLCRKLFEKDFLIGLTEEWKKLDNDARKAGLEHITTLHTQIFGSSKLNVAFFEEPAVTNAEGKKHTRLAQYCEAGIGINIHPDAQHKWDNIDSTLDSFLHECMHHVQGELASNAIMDPQELSDSPHLLAQGRMFYLNFCHYVTPDADNLSPYEQQPIERDAFLFAREAMTGIDHMRTLKRLEQEEKAIATASTSLLSKSL